LSIGSPPSPPARRFGRHGAALRYAGSFRAGHAGELRKKSSSSPSAQFDSTCLDIRVECRLRFGVPSRIAFQFYRQRVNVSKPVHKKPRNIIGSDVSFP
jgi:hypothetical protein